MHVKRGAAAVIVAMLTLGVFGAMATSAGAASTPNFVCTRGVDKKTHKPDVGTAARGGVCSLRFRDADFHSKLKVCFATDAPNIVKALDSSKKPGKPTADGCTLTAHGGTARGLFEPRKKGTFTVTATETLKNGNTVTATTTIVVKH
jgi:hypothetical protein